MSTSDFVQGPAIRGSQMTFLSDAQYIFARRELKTITAVDIIKERISRPFIFIVSEIFAPLSRAVLALGLPAVRLFKFFLSGHPQSEI